MSENLASILELYDRVEQVDFHQRKNEAYLLATYILNVSKEQLISYPDRILSNAEIRDFSNCVERRVKGEPLAYILGEWGFYDHTFKVNSNTLIPRPESECLVDWVLDNLIATRPLRVLEIGCGSGAISISIAAKRANWHITATDISHKTLQVAAENAALIVDSRIKLLTSDMFSNIKRRLGYDVIIANLPYIAKAEMLHLPELKDEPLIALSDGEDGLSLIRKLCWESQRMLKDRGLLIIEHGKRQGIAVKRIAARCNYVNLRQIKDLSAGERVLIAMRGSARRSHRGDNGENHGDNII